MQKDVHKTVYDIMNDKQRKAYQKLMEADFSFKISQLARARVNAFNQSRSARAVFRNIPTMIFILKQYAKSRECALSGESKSQA